MLLNLFAVVESVFRHPFVLLALTTWGAYRFTEQWQRWRQRRDYKYQALVRFSSLSAEALVGLTHILSVRGNIPEEKRQELAIQYLSRRSILLAMDAEFFGVYGEDGQLHDDLVYLKDLMHELHLMTFSTPATPQSAFEPLQNRFTAHRRVMITRMLRTMGFVSEEEEKAILPELMAKAQRGSGR